MNSLLSKLNIDETYTKTPKIVYDKVSENTLPKDGYNYMADVLFLPETKKGYKYLLTMIDLWSKQVDFEPIKDKQPKTILTALKKIFSRRILSKPKASIRTDSGTEFKGVLDKYLHDNSILHRVAETNRHQQVGNIEKLNYDIGRVLNQYMNQKEKETGKTYREWTDILSIVREELNKSKSIRKDKDPFNVDFSEVKMNAKYKIGDLVYYRSDVPLDANGNKQPTKNFRAGDYRYNTHDARKIKSVLYYPKNVRYLLDGKSNVSYAESELLPVKDQPTYIIKKIIGKKTIKGKIHYLVWWKGYKKMDSTWEPRTNLLEDGAGQLIKDFERS